MTGIIRAARRPAGWVAPGPPPGPPPVRIAPRPGEDLCHLAGDWRILQRLDGHRWSLDDLVTAWFAVRDLDAPPARFADLGCGIGAVLMLVAWCFPAARGVGVEAQEVSVDLGRRSLAWNGCDDRCEVRGGDLRDPALLPEGDVFDLVTATPPYLALGTATESSRVQRAPCHFEHRGGLDAYCLAAARLLAPHAPFVTCAAAAQRGRLPRLAAAAGLAIERRLDVIPRAGKPPLFAVFRLRRAAEIVRTVVEAPLAVRDADGRRTEAFVAVRTRMGMPP